MTGAIVKALGMASMKAVVHPGSHGEAAKVAAGFSGSRASTIHKRIFRGNSADPSNTHFFLAENRDANTVFIVDEASLITDSQSFGGSLLQQLVRHVYSAPGCAMILIGDLAQLPPVGMTESLAMNPERLRQIGLNPICFSLEVLRCVRPRRAES